MTAISATPSRRPRLYEVNPTIAATLEIHVRSGKSYAAAAELYGVSQTTWYRWRRLAKDGDPVL